MANSADPDQLASSEAKWSGSTLFANSADPDQLASSEDKWSGSTLFVKAGYIQIQQDKGPYHLVAAQHIITLYSTLEI